MVDPVFGLEAEGRKVDIETTPDRILGVDVMRAPLAGLNLACRAFEGAVTGRHRRVLVSGGVTPVMGQAVAAWMPGTDVHWQPFNGDGLHDAEFDAHIVVLPSAAVVAYYNAVSNSAYSYRDHETLREQRSSMWCGEQLETLRSSIDLMRPGVPLALFGSGDGAWSHAAEVLDATPGLERIDGIVDGHVVAPRSRPLACRYDRVNGQPWTALGTRPPEDMLLGFWRLTDA